MECTHTEENSWWEYDVKGIPLTRVCVKCCRAALSRYCANVLDEEQQKIAYGRVVTHEQYREDSV